MHLPPVRRNAVYSVDIIIANTAGTGKESFHDFAEKIHETGRKIQKFTFVKKKYGKE